MRHKLSLSQKLSSAIILIAALPYFVSIGFSIYLYNHALSFMMHHVGTAEYQAFSRLTSIYYFVLIGLWLVAVVGGFLVVFYFYRRIVRPVETLTGIVSDISQGKDREIPYRKEQDEITPLYNYIGAMNESFSAEIRKLQNINKLKTEFISIASHQLRTPLSSIKWLIEVLLESNSNLTGDQQERLKYIYESNERLIVLVGDLLSAAKLEGGQITVKRQTTDLEKLIQSEIGMQKAEADRRGTKINFKKMVELRVLEIDPLLFSQALKNLLENAVFYSPQNSEVDVTVTLKEGNYVIAVHNEGSVISEIEHDKLFTKFYRGPVAQRLRPEGSGLGLFIAKMAVEANGGRIWFESPTHDSGGVTFYISVPVK